MFIRKGAFSPTGRAGALAMVAAVALTAMAPSMASAGEVLHGKGASAATGNVTDISARRRGIGGGAAAAAAFAGIVGTGIAIAASQNRRSDYDDYDSGPAYYAPAPYYGGYGSPYYHGGYRSGVPYVNGHPIAGW